MASTVTLQDVVNWAMTFTKLTPIIGVAGFQQEPALSICNNVIQELLSEPFNWKFNRSVVPTITTSITAFTQDYQTSVTDCAWFEYADVIDFTSQTIPTPKWQLDVKRTLKTTNQHSEPIKVAYQDENDSGMIVRFWPIPDIAHQWQVNVTYQKKPPIKQSLSDNWAPFPDEIMFVIRQMFLAFAYKQADDQRWSQEYLLGQAFAKKACGIKDMEADDDGFRPAHSIMLG